MYTLNNKINNQLSIWLIIMFMDYIYYDSCWWFNKINGLGLSITKWQLFSGYYLL